MRKASKKVKTSKALSAFLIVLLTIGYLVITGAFAQEASISGTAIQDLTYEKDTLSMGDLWAFTESLYDKSSFGTHMAEKTFTYYTDNTTSTTQVTSNYYGNVEFTEKAAMSGTPLTKHTYSDFMGFVVTGEPIDAVHSQTIPVMNTSGNYGSYTVIPNEEGSYHVYVYYKGDVPPNNLVKYHVVESYESNNTYAAGFNGTAFTASNSLTFTKVANTNWWKSSEIEVNYNLWTAYEVNVTTPEGNNGATDQGLGKHSGSSANTTLNSTKYYYNKWSATAVQFNSLIILQWGSDVKLGPISKDDTITIIGDNDSDDMYSGSVTVQNIFGESIDVGSEVTTIHVPLFITTKPNDEMSLFDGFAEVSIDPYATTEDGGTVFRYDFESTTSLTCQWAMTDSLPTVTLSGNGYTGTTTFYTSNQLNTSYTTGNETVYTLTPNFTDAEGATISYIISEPGKDDVVGTLTEAKSITTCMDSIVVTLTATSESGSTVKTCTITISSISDATLPKVAYNKSTDTEYLYIEDALMEASSGDTIVLLASTGFRTEAQGQKGVWKQNNAGYTIDKGVTLLIPYAANDHSIQTGTNQTDDYRHANAAYSTSTASNLAEISHLKNVSYTLTIPSDVDIYVEGESGNQGRLVIGGTIAGGEGGTLYDGGTYGAHANINLEGTLELGNYSVLSVCGFIYGNGSISTTGDNAEIYQPMVINDWRGAGAGAMFVESDLNGKVTMQSGENEIMPFFYWGAFNIQSTVNISSGNFMYLYGSLREGNAYCSHPVLIGNSTQPGLLILSDNASLVSTYQPITWGSTYTSGFPGKTTIEITGGASLGSFQLYISTGIGSMAVDTSKYTVGIGYYYSVKFVSGDFYIDNSMSILPGMTMTVESNATLYLGQNSAIRFAVLGGLNHRGKQNVTDENKALYQIPYVENKRYDSKNYPTTGELQAATCGGVSLGGDGELIVNGKLVIGANAAVGGLIQTTGEGTVDASSATANSNGKLSATIQIGIVGVKAINFHGRLFAGMSLYSDTAQLVMKDENGAFAIRDLIPGRTYNGSANTLIRSDYKFTYYPSVSNIEISKILGVVTGASGTVDTPAGQTTHPLNENVYGVWMCDQHSYSSVITAPTCTEAGYTTYTCSVCGNSYTDSEVSATGHTPNEAVKENETAFGYDSVVYCKTCGAEISRDYVATEIISVTITWGSMNFVYTKGEWSPETHTYKVGSITPKTTGANVITVTNNSTVSYSLYATFSYTNNTGYSLTAEFTDSSDTALTDNKLTLSANDATAKEVKLALTTGEHITAAESVTVGTVTVAISTE